MDARYPATKTAIQMAAKGKLGMIIRPELTTPTTMMMATPDCDTRRRDYLGI